MLGYRRIRERFSTFFFTLLPGSDKFIANSSPFLTHTILAMLNYVKTVLTKVSFDARLFEKELRKAINVLLADELRDLKHWCYTRFGNQYETILNRCFVAP